MLCPVLLGSKGAGASTPSSALDGLTRPRRSTANAPRQTDDVFGCLVSAPIRVVGLAVICKREERGPSRKALSVSHPSMTGSETSSPTGADQSVMRVAVTRKADRSFMLAEVQKNGLSLAHASAILRGDRDVVHAAVRQNCHALKFAAYHLRNDPSLVLAAVKGHGLALQYASSELWADKKFVLAVVQQYGHALKHVSEGLRGDVEVVMAAVQQNGRALEHASLSLRGHCDVVAAAVNQNGHALEHASKKLRNSRLTVLHAVKKNGLSLAHASKELQANREVVLLAVQQNWEALKYASGELQADKAIVLAALKRRLASLHDLSVRQLDRPLQLGLPDSAASVRSMARAQGTAQGRPNSVGMLPARPEARHLATPARSVLSHRSSPFTPMRPSTGRPRSAIPACPMLGPRPSSAMPARPLLRPRSAGCGYPTAI